MIRSLKARASALLCCATFASSLVLACSGSDAGDSTFGNPSGSDGGAGGNGSGNGGGAGSLGGGGSGGPGSADAACAATSSKGQQAPLDLFIMLDQSKSMTDPVSGGGTKWDAVTAALNAFVGSPQTGVSVGIQYFGLPPSGSGSGGGCVAGTPCQSSADCGGGTCRKSGVCACNGSGGGDSCTSGDYATPDVEIGPLPGIGAKIKASIAAHSPSTSTPTAPALQGAIDHATTWSKAHANDVTVVVFATDGDPTECTPQDIPSISQIAANGAKGTPKILTFVIGVGTSTANLNAIAQGGGTGNAFIVDTNANAQQQFLDALNKIRGSALGCTYQIPLPASGTPDFNSVNVQYISGSGTTVTIPKVNDKTQCPASGEAWYYDNNATPTQILLCDATCKTILADAKGEVDVLLGCATVVK